MENKTVSLKNGIVIVPDDFIVVEATISENVNFAFVVAEKNGTSPHFLILAEKSLREFTIEDEVHAIDLCCEIYPKLSEIRKQEVEAKITRDGLFENESEWKVAPCLGIFGVPEIKNEDNMFGGTGIFREI